MRFSGLLRCARNDELWVNPMNVLNAKFLLAQEWRIAQRLRKAIDPHPLVVEAINMRGLDFSARWE